MGDLVSALRLKILNLILKILEFDASSFRISCIKMIDEVSGIISWRTIGKIFEFLIQVKKTYAMIPVGWKLNQKKACSALPRH